MSEFYAFIHELSIGISISIGSILTTLLFCAVSLSRSGFFELPKLAWVISVIGTCGTIVLCLGVSIILSSRLRARRARDAGNSRNSNAEILSSQRTQTDNEHGKGDLGGRSLLTWNFRGTKANHTRNVSKNLPADTQLAEICSGDNFAKEVHEEFIRSTKNHSDKSHNSIARGRLGSLTQLRVTNPDQEKEEITREEICTTTRDGT